MEVVPLSVNPGVASHVHDFIQTPRKVLLPFFFLLAGSSLSCPLNRDGSFFCHQERVDPSEHFFLSDMARYAVLSCKLSFQHRVFYLSFPRFLQIHHLKGEVSSFFPLEWSRGVWWGGFGHGLGFPRWQSPSSWVPNSFGRDKTFPPAGLGRGLRRSEDVILFLLF